MKNILPLIALLAIAHSASAGPEWHHAQKLCERSNETFSIEYTFGESCYVPLTSPLGQLHYDATIAVFKLNDGKREQIGGSIDGTYVEKGCFEDIPCNWVDQAIANSKARLAYATNELGWTNYIRLPTTTNTINLSITNTVTVPIVPSPDRTIESLQIKLAVSIALRLRLQHPDWHYRDICERTWQIYSQHLSTTDIFKEIEK